MRSIVRSDEYEICLRRGHDSTGTAITVGWVTNYVCRWCGVTYVIERIERELNPPEEEGGASAESSSAPTPPRQGIGTTHGEATP